MLTVKICGLKEPEHAIAAAEVGANLLGVNFVPGVRRRITPEQAIAIIQAVRKARGAGTPKFVGLFADQPIAEVNGVAKAVGLDYVQLCGNESSDFCKETAVPPLKVLHVRSDVPRQQTVITLDKRLAQVNSAGWLGLLDKQSDTQQGGTGQSFDWTIATELAARGHRFLLAGGLTPENVAHAVHTVHPYGVDVSSGVETNGAKDVIKILAFVKAARS